MDEEQERFDNRLRELVVLEMETHKLSYPLFLQRVGIPKDAPDFETLRQSLYRWVTCPEDKTYRLSHYLYDRVCEYFRSGLTDHDRLSASLFRSSEKACDDYQRSLVAFYNVKAGRLDELEETARGRFLFYKRPLSPHLQGFILRSYIRIGRPRPEASFVMITEYQNGDFPNKDVGMEVVEDFFVGVCIQKDGVLVFRMRHLTHGAVKDITLPNIGMNSGARLISGAYGYVSETCQAFTPNRLAISGCVLKRIPDTYTNSEINALSCLVHRDTVDPEIAAHVFSVTV